MSCDRGEQGALSLHFLSHCGPYPCVCAPFQIVENRQGGQGRAIGEVLLDRGPLAKLPIHGEGAEIDSARERLNKLIRSCGQLERERRPTIVHVLAALKDIYDSLCAPGG